MPEPVLKRTRYFDQEFLRAADFTGEQDYHVRSRRRLSRLFFLAGVADGLEVVNGSDATGVTVRSGVAVDAQGREIVLPSDAALDMAASTPGTVAWVTIAYQEQATDPSAAPGQGAEMTRMTESSQPNLQPASPADPSVQIPLARLTRTVSGVAIDLRPRRYVEPRIRGGLSVGSDQNVVIRRGLFAAGTTDGAPTTLDTVVGGMSFAGYGVQHGMLSFRAGRGFELVDRSQEVSPPPLQYARDSRTYADLAVGGLRANDLYLSGNRDWASLSVNCHHLGGAWTFPNPSVPAVTVEMDAAGGEGRFDVWSTTKGNTQGFVQRLRIAGESGNVLLCHNGGRLGVGTGSPSALLDVNGQANINGSLEVRQSLTVGAGSNGWVKVRHIDGKHYLNDNHDDLFLNWSTGRRVVVNGNPPGGTKPWLHVGGDNLGGLPDWSGGGLVAWDVFARGWVYTGGVNASVKKFVIDHPVDPARRELVHASIEGPEVGVYYRGEASLVDGSAVIELPSYFEALTRRDGRTIQVTPKLKSDGPFTAVAASAVADGRFVVRGADGGDPAQAFYWEVKAVRADIDPLEVEPAKPAVGLPAMA